MGRQQKVITMKREKIWDDVSVRDVRELIVKQPTTISPDASLRELLAKYNEDLRTRHVYVVDADSKLLGVVRMNTIVRFLFPYAAVAEEGASTAYEMALNPNIQTVVIEGADPLEMTAENIMNDDPYSVTEDTQMHDLAKILIRDVINELPVVDTTGKIIGQINVYEIIDEFLRRHDA